MKKSFFLLWAAVCLLTATGCATGRRVHKVESVPEDHRVHMTIGRGVQVKGMDGDSVNWRYYGVMGKQMVIIAPGFHEFDVYYSVQSGHTDVFQISSYFAPGAYYKMVPRKKNVKTFWGGSFQTIEIHFEEARDEKRRDWDRVADYEFTTYMTKVMNPTVDQKRVILENETVRFEMGPEMVFQWENKETGLRYSGRMGLQFTEDQDAVLYLKDLQDRPNLSYEDFTAKVDYLNEAELTLKPLWVSDQIVVYRTQDDRPLVFRMRIE